MSEPIRSINKKISPVAFWLVLTLQGLLFLLFAGLAVSLLYPTSGPILEMAGIYTGAMLSIFFSMVLCVRIYKNSHADKPKDPAQ